MLIPALAFNLDGLAELEVYCLAKVQGPEVLDKPAVAPEVGLKSHGDNRYACTFCKLDPEAVEFLRDKLDAARCLREI